MALLSRMGIRAIGRAWPCAGGYLTACAFGEDVKLMAGFDFNMPEPTLSKVYSSKPTGRLRFNKLKQLEQEFTVTEYQYGRPILETKEWKIVPTETEA